MMLDIFPYLRIGNVELGRTPDELRNVFSNDYSTQVTEFFNRQTDYFLNAAMQVEYDEFNQCAFIGVSEPIVPWYKGVNLFEMTFADVQRNFGDADRNIYIEPNSVVLLDTGLSFYYEDLEDNSTAQQISIFKKGYYDSVLNLYEKTRFDV